MSDVRAGLLRAAVAEIEANGLGAASLRAIARRCGVTHQATSHHFRDRAGLFTTLAAEGFERLREESVAAVEAVPDEGDEPLVAAGLAYLAFASAQPTTFDVMFRPELLHGDDPRLVAARTALWEHGLAVVQRACDRGWGGGVPADMLNLACWSTVHGLAMIRRDTAASPPGSGAAVLPQDDAAMIRRVVGAIMR